MLRFQGFSSFFFDPPLLEGFLHYISSFNWSWPSICWLCRSPLEQGFQTQTVHWIVKGRGLRLRFFCKTMQHPQLSSTLSPLVLMVSTSHWHHIPAWTSSGNRSTGSLLFLFFPQSGLSFSLVVHHCCLKWRSSSSALGSLPLEG